ncbi:myozenin-2-like isoform X4 [Perca fluviatilis]|uniref:myozenin-2-like isoform X4 n=1 Tax=Perca fluviatilis TaxID=8168 RepID=UPI001965045D|nr:myozenin-2-like isoform X4 [Perca fluviatilis]
MTFIQAVPSLLRRVRVERGSTPAPVQDKELDYPDQLQHHQKEMMMQSGLDDVTKQRMLQAKALCKEARGVKCGLEGLNLGKKISVPKDVMMEELNLPSNRGSRMFQERQKRVERFTLENAANGAYSTNNNVYSEAVPPPQTIPEPQGGKENQAFSIPGKHSLVMNLQKTVAKKGSPDVLAPGYSGPLKEIPHEKFNTTIIPKSYSSPWSQALGDNTELLNALNTQLPQLPQRLQPSNYRCFNRSALPFGGAMASRRVIPVIGFEAVDSQNLPGIALERMCRRPNFNRAPKGWGCDFCPESNEL